MPLPRAPRPPKILSPAEQLTKHYLALHNQIDNGFFPAALKSCERILRLNPTDTLAQSTKCQLLISLDQYSNALQLLKTTPDLPRALEVYCQYKSGREGEAKIGLLSLADEEEGANGDDRAGKVIEAQLLYRMEQYAESRDAFEELLATADSVSAPLKFSLIFMLTHHSIPSAKDSPELLDLQTNLDACNSHLDFLASVPSLVASSSTLPSIETLESTPIGFLIHSHAEYRPTPRVLSKSRATPQQSIKRVKVPKKLPKNYSPTKTLDPDRWLPKRERPGFAEEIVRKREMERGRKKGKEREKLMMQGGAEVPVAVASPAKSGGASANKKKKGKK